MLVIKANGIKEEYDSNKARQFMLRCGVPAGLVGTYAAEVEKELHDGVSTSTIYEKIHEVLTRHKAFHPPRISIKQGVAALGPSGFPFEQFVSRIFIAQGYKVLTDQQIRGQCVEHEVDVIAYNDTELIVCEVKFHNQLGIKSDLKVALYVKARFEDITDGDVIVDGVKRKMTKGLLITNTKFTSSALEYAMCKGLELLGWNTPQGRGLEEFIHKHNLLPITCLSEISHDQKAQLINAGIILVRELIANHQKVVSTLNLSPNHAYALMTEARSLFTSA